MITLAFVTSLALAAAPKSAVHELPVGSLSVRPDIVRNAPTVEIEVMLVIEPGNVRHYRMDRKLINRQGKVEKSAADSRTCPALLTELAKAEELPMPRFLPPGSKTSADFPVLLLHATTYTLTMQGYESGSKTDANIELRAQSGSPLAQWADTMLAALEPCWTDRVS
jgi:hypothetical protein